MKGVIIIPSNKEIGERIKKLRQEAKLSQSELADIIGVSSSTIGMYEIGERIPRDQIKIEIAKVLKRSVAYIFFKD